MKNESKAKAILLLVFVTQLLVAAGIMLAFGSYVWLIQLQYDAAAKAAEWTDRIWMPFYYALAVAAAGFSYDCAKTVLFLKRPSFEKFLAHIGAVFGYFGLILVLLAAGFYLLNWPDPGAKFAGQVFYLLGFGTAYFAIQSASNALDVAVTGDHSEKPARRNAGTRR